MTYFTHYWQNGTWFSNQQAEDGALLDHTASNLFRQRNVVAGDSIYVFTVFSGRLYLCGRMVVGKLCRRAEAVRIVGRPLDELWDAEWHAIASEATPMRFDRAVPLRVTARLRFHSRRRPALTFAAPGRLADQTLRTVRRLTPTSAAVLDGLLPALEPVDLL